MNAIIEAIRSLQANVYAFAVGWMCAWFMSWISSTITNIVAIIIFLAVLSMSGVLYWKPAPSPPVFVSADEDVEFTPIDGLVDFT